MKKGVVVVLVLLAAIVLVSPAIVGRLAEQSVDENLNWAASESGEVSITSGFYERGWFASEGQHRVELRDGQLKTLVQSAAGRMPDDGLPVLVINTRLDHGLIPVSSMSRDGGALAAGEHPGEPPRAPAVGGEGGVALHALRCRVVAAHDHAVPLVAEGDSLLLEV